MGPLHILFLFVLTYLVIGRALCEYYMGNELREKVPEWFLRGIAVCFISVMIPVIYWAIMNEERSQ